ncbi:PDZ domain-containing protein [Gemmatimonas sp.]|uniref:PDZ domain-containing protein n=1 Tax=Gemmatimonas sp. TaxID=1962908 RepID=UPI0027B8F49F|nr:PDZ domain-containing protein [Gemmatimonas sp.]
MARKVKRTGLALSGVVGGVLAALSLPAALEAQQSATPASSRARSAVRRPAPSPLPAGAGNACLELESSPSPLVYAPEGLALLRLKKQLESAALTLEQRQQLEGDQVQRIAQVQRGMDSLMQLVVRFAREDGRDERRIVLRKVADGQRVMVTDNIVGGVPIPLEERVSRGLITITRVGGDSTTVTLGPQLDRVIRTLAPKVAAFAGEAEAALPGRSVAPSGYMGLSLSGAQIRIVTPDGVMTSHCEYPMVETVDVGSPAARAGLTAGDTLVAYNGRDVTQAAVNYAELIAAGTTVKVRVRRAGKPRDVPVVVDARREEARAVPAGVTVRGVPLTSPVMPTAMFNPSGVAVLAGAQFATMDAEFAQSLGLESGVLVLRVPAGTPAADAGLKAGEVVRSVNGTAVRDVAQLRRVLASLREPARLVVQGKGAAGRVVELR